MYLLFGIICRHVSKGEAGGVGHVPPQILADQKVLLAAAAPRLTSLPPRFLDFDTCMICRHQFLTSVLYRPSAVFLGLVMDVSIETSMALSAIPVVEFHVWDKLLLISSK